MTVKITVTVSGSFRRHMTAIQDVVYTLADSGAEVLSPADPRIVDAFGDFVFVASDRLRAVKAVQSRHLQAIAASTFLWLVSPDGYVGPSAAMEVGFATALQVPVFTDCPPNDLTLRQYVSVLPNVQAALQKYRPGVPTEQPNRSAFILDPANVESGHRHLEVIRGILVQSSGSCAEQDLRLAGHAQALRDGLRGLT